MVNVRLAPLVNIVTVTVVTSASGVDQPRRGIAQPARTRFTRSSQIAGSYILKMNEMLSFFKELRHTPLWILLGLAMASDVAVLSDQIRQNAPSELIFWLHLSALAFTSLAITKFVDDIINFIRQRKSQQLLVAFSPMRNQCNWNFAKQSDGRCYTQVNIGLLATNLTDKPLGFANPRIKRSPIGLGRETIILDVLIQSTNGREFGSTVISKFALEPNFPQQVLLHGFFEKMPWFQKSGYLSLEIALSDTQGNEHVIAVDLKQV